MISNDYLLEENQDNHLNSWAQNSMYFSTKEDFSLNMIDTHYKKNLVQLSYSENANANKFNYSIEEHYNPDSHTEDIKTKRKKIFIVKKYVEYDEILKEIYSDGDENLEETMKTQNKLLKKKRVPIKKKEKNYLYLNQLEKVEKLNRLSKLVKRYRRKYSGLQEKIKKNIRKIFKKYIYKKLNINFKNKYLNHNLNLDLFQLIKTLKRIHSVNFENFDEKHIIENLINLIAENKIPFDSINFKKICSQIRLFLPNDKIRYVNKKSFNYTINFPEREIKISEIEYDFYRNYLNKYDVLRSIFGLKEEKYINASCKDEAQYKPIVSSLIKNLIQDEKFKGTNGFLVINENINSSSKVGGEIINNIDLPVLKANIQNNCLFPFTKNLFLLCKVFLMDKDSSHTN